VVNQPGQTYAALPYLWDFQTGASVGEYIMTDQDPTLAPTLLNGNEWAQIGSFYGAGVSSYFRNTAYANLPPATFAGLSASVSDSTTQVWGAAVSGGSSNYAQVGSNGTNWTVTGK
jgi:hypothetical protein